MRGHWLHSLSVALLTATISLPCAIAAEGEAVAPPRAALPVAELKRETPVDFEKEILPFFKSSCLACHNTTKAKAGLNLETPQLMLKGGDSGPAFVAGQGATSLVFKVAAHLDPEMVMPPKDNKANAPNLTPDQLALLKLWIDQGGKGEVQAAAPVNWLEKPPLLDPILAVALTEDGQFAACGRGNRIDVYHVPSRRLVATLADTKLASVGLTNAAHRDLVNALAFSADGTLLASAGYREVKLWRRPHDAGRSVSTNVAPLFALSPDRRWLATAETNFSITLIDLATGQASRSLEGHSNRLSALRFSPDSQRVASISADRTLRAWPVLSNTPMLLAEIPAEPLAFAWLDDQAFAVGGADGVIRISSLTNLSTFAELKSHTAAVTGLEAWPGGKELLSGSADGMARRWKISEAKVVLTVTNAAAIVSVALRPDGKRFATSGTNGVVKLWNAEDGKRVAELKGDRYAYERVAGTERALVIAKSDVEFRKKSLEKFEADHKKQNERLAKATETNNITGKALAERSKEFTNAQVAVTTADKALVDLLAEIQRVTSAFETADLSARSASTNAKTASEKAAQTQLAAERALLSKADADRIVADAASVAARTKAALDNADAAKDTARRIAEESAGVAEKSRGFAEAVSADSEMKTKLSSDARASADKAIEELARLAFAAGQLKPAYDKTLAEAPEKRKAATNTIETANKTLAAAEKEFKRAETRHSVLGHELELAQQGQLRASNALAGAKSALTIVEGRQKQTESDLDRLKKAATAAEQIARAVAFSPDGVTLATVTDGGKVHTWSAETGAAFDVFTNVAPGSTVAFLDATTLAVTRPQASSTDLVRLDLQPQWAFERAIGNGDLDSPLSDRVNAVRFSPDGNLLATGGGEPTRSGEIKLWNLADGKLSREFTNVHSDAVLALDFSPDGQLLASSSADRFARVVDLSSGKVVKAFEGHTSYVLGVAWKADSRTLASAGADNVVKVWDAVTGERRKNIEGAGKEATSVMFRGVSGEALVTSGDGQVRLLRENGEVVRSFEGAADFMNAGALTPDGSTIVAGGQDGVLHLWNSGSKDKLASFAPAR
jgi:WD40 repeat protein